MGKPLNVLIVDDSDDDAGLQVRELRRGGFEPVVERVEAAEDMRAALAARTWDAILCDYKLPKFSVPAALALMHELGLDLPFIVVSGTIGEERAADLMRAGADDLVLKDNLARLIPAIERGVAAAEVRREREEAEEALRERERRLQGILENAVDAIITIDVQGRIESFNPAAERIFGYRADEVVGKNVKLVMPEPYHSEHDGYIGRYLKTGERKIIGIGREVTARRADGTIFPIDLAVTEIRAGGKRSFMGTARDITSRKRAEEAIKESESWLKRAQEVARMGYYVWDEVKYESVYRSDVACDIFGIPSEQKGRLFDDTLKLVHPDDRERVEAAFAAVSAAGEAYDIEYRIVRPAGDIRHVRDVSDPEYDETGAVIRKVGALLDITERKRAEEALRLQALITEQMFDAIIGCDLEGRIVEWNAAAERIFGYSREEVVGKPPGFLHRPEEREQIDGAIQTATARGETWSGDVAFVRRDGSEGMRQIVCSPVHEESSGIIANVSVSRDVTERNAIQAQLRQAQKMEAVGQLTGGVAHDFNNLLTVILGNLQLLDRAVGADDRLKKRIKTASDAALRGAQLTKRLLAFARRQVLEPKRVDINELVTNAEDMLRRTLGETIRLRSVLAEDPWPARVDPHQLETALLNLALNARDAMPEGGTLTIETANVVLDDDYAARHIEVEAGRYVMLAVSDSGTGMSPEAIENCFEPFFTTKETGKGTGLGLSMVYGYVKQSGGHVKVYSEEGHGTTVKLYLPSADGAVMVAQDDEVEDAEAPSGSETILLVEDEESVRETLVALLEELGYRVLEASEGPEALDLLEAREGIDLLLTDIVLPGGMKGTAVASEARKRRPDIKVLYMSGYTAEAILGNDLRAEKAEFIPKPPQREELARKIRHVLDN